MLHAITTQIGQIEKDHGVISDALHDYFHACGLDLVPNAEHAPYWGGALLCWAAVQCGLEPPSGGIDPVAWLSWGHALAHPKSGAIVVLTSGNGNGALEVGVITRLQGNKLYLVGAHDRAVCVRAVPLERIIATRWPPVANDQAPMSTAVAPPITNGLPAPESREVANPAGVPYKVPTGTGEDFIGDALPRILAKQPMQPQPVNNHPQSDDVVRIGALQAFLDVVKGAIAERDEKIDFLSRNAIVRAELREDKDDG